MPNQIDIVLLPGASISYDSRDSLILAIDKHIEPILRYSKNISFLYFDIIFDWLYRFFKWTKYGLFWLLFSFFGYLNQSFHLRDRVISLWKNFYHYDWLWGNISLRIWYWNLLLSPFNHINLTILQEGWVNEDRLNSSNFDITNIVVVISEVDLFLFELPYRIFCVELRNRNDD